MSTIYKYDDPLFVVINEARYSAVQGPASATDFAHFRSRNKVLIRAIHINMRSAASGTAGSLHYTRDGATLATKTISAASVGYSAVLTLTASNTLSSIGMVAAVRITGAADKGKWDVLYEYSILGPAPQIGS